MALDLRNNAPCTRSFFPACMFLAATLITLATPALADNTFLLQLGSSDTEKSASDKWAEVKANNADVLAGLSLHIAEVSMPSDNHTSYRTQVGPVASRAQASSICSTLQSRNVDCDVVETAMYASETAPDQPEDTDVKPAPAVTAMVMPVPHTIKASAHVAEDTLHQDDPDYVPPPVDSGPVIIAGDAAPATPVAEAVPAEPAPVVRSIKHMQTVDETEDANDTPASNSRYVPGRGPRFLDTSMVSKKTVVASAPPVESPAPVEPPTVPAQAAEVPSKQPGFFGRLFGSSPPKPASSEGVTGSVQVSEAVRVPLSTDESQTKQKMVPVLPPVHGLGGNPSDSTDKTFWAQISYFRDESQALDFYRQFSNSYPQFSDGVRIRITRPFGLGSAARVSLRAGPFAGTDDVNTICAAAAHWNARCTVVRELGTSSANDTSAPTHSSRSHTTSTHNSDLSTDHGVYWAQLGTYPSEEEAWDAWNDMKSNHKKALRHAHASVAAPQASSAARSVYRLHAGPLDLSSANSLCNRLQKEGLDCIVVNDK